MGNSPKRQHFIPKSYLKRFAEIKGDKYFVEAHFKATGETKSDISTKDICLEKNLYTLPSAEDSEKYSLELYYANEVDKIYPEVYSILIDENVKQISTEDRWKILYTIMSMYFRTPKLLNGYGGFTDRTFDNISHYVNKETGMVNVNFVGTPMEFHISKLEEVKKEQRKINHQAFLLTHFKLWHDYVQHKYLSGLFVYKIEGDMELITSDNPINIRSSSRNSFNLFDPTNLITVPLDRRHYLTIFSNTDVSDLHSIHRSQRDKWFALTTNHSSDQNSENCILGYPGTVSKHINDQKLNSELNPENNEMLNNLIQKTERMRELWAIVERTGDIRHSEVINKIKELQTLPETKNDGDLGKIIQDLSKLGLI